MNPVPAQPATHTRSVARRPMRGLVTAALAIVACAAPATARQADCCPPAGPAEAIGRLPRDVELALVVENAAVTRKTATAAALLQSLAATDRLVPELLPAWQNLAAELEWPADEAFDRIVGSRFMLVVRGVEDPEQRRWAILSEVSDTTEQRIRERLAVAQRKVIDEHPIFALESGRYELTSLRHAAAIPKGVEPVLKAGGGRPCTVTLVLGPADRPQLFDELVRAMARPGLGETLAATDAVRKAAGLEPADVMLAVRVDPQDRAGGKPWENFIVAGARIETDTCRARAVLRDSDLRADFAAVPRSSDACLGALAAEPLLAVVESRLGKAGPEDEPRNPLQVLLSQFDFPQGVLSLLTARQALVITAPAQGAPPGVGAAAIRATVAMETSDVSKLAPAGDECLSAMARGLEQKYGDAAHPAPCFGGVACSAIREMSLQLSAECPVSSLFGAPLSAAWCYSVPPVAAGAVAAPESVCAARGWWVVSLGPGGTTNRAGVDSVRRVCGALAGDRPAGGDTRAWISMGVAAPARWSRIMDPKSSQLGAILKSLSRVESLEWRLWVNGDGDAEGTIGVRVGAAAPAAAAPPVAAPPPIPTTTR